MRDERQGPRLAARREWSPPGRRDSPHGGEQPRWKQQQQHSRQVVQRDGQGLRRSPARRWSPIARSQATHVDGQYRGPPDMSPVGLKRAHADAMDTRPPGPRVTGFNASGADEEEADEDDDLFASKKFRKAGSPGPPKPPPPSPLQPTAPPAVSPPVHPVGKKPMNRWDVGKRPLSAPAAAAMAPPAPVDVTPPSCKSAPKPTPSKVIKSIKSTGFPGVAPRASRKAHLPATEQATPIRSEAHDSASESPAITAVASAAATNLKLDSDSASAKDGAIGPKLQPPPPPPSEVAPAPPSNSLLAKAIQEAALSGHPGIHQTPQQHLQKLGSHVAQLDSEFRAHQHWISHDLNEVKSQAYAHYSSANGFMSTMNEQLTSTWQHITAMNNRVEGMRSDLDLHREKLNVLESSSNLVKASSSTPEVTPCIVSHPPSSVPSSPTATHSNSPSRAAAAVDLATTFLEPSPPGLACDDLPPGLPPGLTPVEHPPMIPAARPCTEVPEAVPRSVDAGHEVEQPSYQEIASQPQEIPAELPSTAATEPLQAAAEAPSADWQAPEQPQPHRAADTNQARNIAPVNVEHPDVTPIAAVSLAVSTDPRGDASVLQATQGQVRALQAALQEISIRLEHTRQEVDIVRREEVPFAHHATSQVRDDLQRYKDRFAEHEARSINFTKQQEVSMRSTQERVTRIAQDVVPLLSGMPILHRDCDHVHERISLAMAGQDGISSEHASFRHLLERTQAELSTLKSAMERVIATQANMARAQALYSQQQKPTVDPSEQARKNEHYVTQVKKYYEEELGKVRRAQEEQAQQIKILTALVGAQSKAGVIAMPTAPAVRGVEVNSLGLSRLLGSASLSASLNPVKRTGSGAAPGNAALQPAGKAHTGSGTRHTSGVESKDDEAAKGDEAESTGNETVSTSSQPDVATNGKASAAPRSAGKASTRKQTRAQAQREKDAGP